jgi:hypothetical protein
MELVRSCKQSHSTTSQCHNYGKKYMTITAENLKVMFWCQIISKRFYNSLEQDMWLAEAIYFLTKCYFLLKYMAIPVHYTRFGSA